MGYLAPSTGKGFIQAWHTLFNPNDSTTYYWGYLTGSGIATTQDYNIMVPVSCTIQKIAIHIACTVGGADNVALSIRVNDTTDYTVTATLQYDTTPQRNTYTVDIPLSAGDFFTFKEVTPAWAANPTQIRKLAVLQVEFT